MTRRIAVVGIDGCGKSSVIARLRELAPERNASFASMTCPDFHDTPNAPLQELSRRMKAFSDGCDEIGSLEMKLLAMYMQMTLYGPVEKFFVDTFAPSVLVCERHPLVESLVYGPFYVALARPDWDGAALEPKIREVLDRHHPGTFDVISAWNDAESARLGTDTTLWDWLADIGELVQKEPATTVSVLQDRYRTTVPDDVLWLDVPAEHAAARCAERSADGVIETHETPEFLAALRERYQQTRQAYAEAFPHVRFHRIDTSDGVDIEQSVRACVEDGELFETSATTRESI